MSKINGADLTKWYIYRSHDGSWGVCPPVRSDDPNWYKRGGRFPTGTEALAAFAAGGKQ